MPLLLLASLVWAFSFGLIGNRLQGLDPAVVAAARLGLSMLVFAPCACRARLTLPMAALLLLLGGVQFGLMYVLYIAAFVHLPSHLVALFTIFTPLYVALLAGLEEPHRLRRTLTAALLAVAGTAVLAWRAPRAARLWTGFALVQGSNICFALGQVGYRRLMRRAEGLSDAQAVAWMYAGAVMTVLPFAAAGRRARRFAPSLPQLAVLVYLGVVASGLCFWLWNRGARRARPGTLAVMNNAKIPLGVAVSLLLFKEPADIWRLSVAGAAMLLALVICETGGK
jgi:drug/metabolite transporter (DMT)-like permease